jgi:hypothetical protein
MALKFLALAYFSWSYYFLNLSLHSSDFLCHCINVLFLECGDLFLERLLGGVHTFFNLLVLMLYFLSEYGQCLEVVRVLQEGLLDEGLDVKMLTLNF